MRNATSNSTLNPFVPASHVLLSVGLAAGIMAIPFSLQVALLPAAVIFGWSQIGGL